MARIRYLKPDFFKDEDLAEHPYWVRLLFAGLWNIADKEGRLEDRIKRIKIDIFPYDKVDIEKGLKVLAERKNYGTKPFIIRYEVDGARYIQITNWHRHQKPHHTERESEIPPTPPNIMEKGMEKQLEGSVKLRNGELTVKRRLVTEFFDYFLLKTKKSLKLTPERKKIIEKRLDDDYTLEQLKLAVDNFMADEWPDRHKFIDIVYCLGIRNKVDNLDKWLNVKSKSKPEPKSNPNCDICKGKGIILEGTQKGAQCLCVK